MFLKLICFFRGHKWVQGGKKMYYHHDKSLNVWCYRCGKSVHRSKVLAEMGIDY